MPATKGIKSVRFYPSRDKGTTNGATRDVVERIPYGWSGNKKLRSRRLRAGVTERRCTPRPVRSRAPRGNRPRKRALRGRESARLRAAGGADPRGAAHAICRGVGGACWGEWGAALVRSRRRKLEGINGVRVVRGLGVDFIKDLTAAGELLDHLWRECEAAHRSAN